MIDLYTAVYSISCSYPWTFHMMRLLSAIPFPDYAPKYRAKSVDVPGQATLRIISINLSDMPVPPICNLRQKAERIPSDH